MDMKKNQGKLGKRKEERWWGQQMRGRGKGELLKRPGKNLDSAVTRTQGGGL